MIGWVRDARHSAGAADARALLSGLQAQTAHAAQTGAPLLNFGAITTHSGVVDFLRDSGYTVANINAIYINGFSGSSNYGVIVGVLYNGFPAGVHPEIAAGASGTGVVIPASDRWTPGNTAAAPHAILPPPA
jgi:hypothetical protein